MAKTLLLDISKNPHALQDSSNSGGSVNVTIQDVSTAISDEDGFATAYNVKQYVASEHEWLEFS